MSVAPVPTERIREPSPATIIWPLPLIVTAGAATASSPWASVIIEITGTNNIVSLVPNGSPLTSALQPGTAKIEPSLTAFSALRSVQAVESGLSLSVSTVRVAACDPEAISAVAIAAARRFV